MALALILAFAAPSGARIHKQAPAECHPGRSHVIAADGQAQVYAADDFEDSPTIFGCVYGRRSYALGPGPPMEQTCSSGCVGTRHEVLTGAFVAYEEFRTKGAFERGEAIWRVVVRDLRNGRVLRRLPTGVFSPPEPATIGAGEAVAIVVKSDGAVAWIAETDGETGQREVHAADATGSRILASGTSIDPASLALGGGTLYWTQEGKPMSATLH